jgi:tubulin alpha
LTCRYLLEHGLKADGRLDPEVPESHNNGGSFETFFTETTSGKYVPRSIFVDLDPSVRYNSDLSPGSDGR